MIDNTPVETPQKELKNATDMEMSATSDQESVYDEQQRMFKLLSMFQGNDDNICDKIDIANQVAQKQKSKQIDPELELNPVFDQDYKYP
jgi:hypothetical protein